MRHPENTEKSGEKDELSQGLCVVNAGRRTATIREQNEKQAGLWKQNRK